MPSSKRSVVWISRNLLDAMHAHLVTQYGGMHGVADSRLLDTALDRSKHLLAHVPESSLAVLAASLAFGLTKNRGYRDGNKRTAFTAAAVFLRLNGYRLDVAEVEAVSGMVYLATDVLTESQFAEWVAEHIYPIAK